MLAYTLFALLFTGVIAIASRFKSGRYFLQRYAKQIFFLAMTVIFSLSGYFSFRQYEVWLGDPLAKFLLPPYQDINYFAFHSFTNFFAPYLVSLFAALVFLLAAIFFNRRAGGIFFEKEELYLAAISLFLVGHPGWLIYFIALILIYFILHTSYFILQRKTIRLPLYPLWAPTAFFVILVNEYWLSNTHWWQLLSF